MDSQRLAGNLLNELTPQGVRLASLGPDQRIAVAALDGMEVTFRTAVLPWSWDRCRVAFMQDEVQDPNDVEVLQVVLPDAERRLPGDPGRDATCMCCPDLSGPGGFLYAQPFIAPDLRWCGAEHGPHALVDDGLLVSAPVIEWILGNEALTSTITDRWLSVTAMPREARRVRSRMRRLERDGLARPLALTSAPPGEVCNTPAAASADAACAGRAPGAWIEHVFDSEEISD